MSWREAIIANLPPSREDEPHDLRRDILDELEDHLDCAMRRELLRSPESDEETARRRVLARFGDPAQVALKLWFDAMKEKLMNQRILIGTNILMVAAVIVMVGLVSWSLSESRSGREVLRTQIDEMVGLQTALVESVQGLQQTGSAPANIRAASLAMTDEPAEQEDWAARFDAIDDNWRAAYALGNELLRLPPKDGLAIVRENWSRLSYPQDRQFLLNAFQHSAASNLHPHTIEVLHLGMMDSAHEVRARAIELLKPMAFLDFAHDPAKYEKWRERHRDKNEREVVVDSLRDWVARLHEAQGAEYGRAMKILTMPAINTLAKAFVREAAADAGLLDFLEEQIAKAREGNLPPRQREGIGVMIRRFSELRPEEKSLRRVIVPMLTHADIDWTSAATRALAGKHNAWARDLIKERLIESVTSRRQDHRAFTYAQVLASYGDPSVIPTMIGLIDADGTYNTVYGIGWFGLNQLTGVNYDESHDGPWWRDWWARNKERYPEHVQAMEIPNFSGRMAQQSPGLEVQSIWPLITLDDDDQKRYYLVGPADDGDAPAEGYKLLLVLPGGDGSAEFHPFVSSLLNEALPEGYVLAQLIAPVFDEQGARMIVWSTEALQQPNARFTTEQFIEAVIEDVSKRLAVDTRHVYALGWSSGGPPVYNAAAGTQTRLAGGFVAMSVFRPDWMPTIGDLTGRSFYILHSPTDFIAMTFPERARDTLTAAGANVHLQTYEGGHGWHGDVYGMIRAGVEWLQKQQQHIPRNGN